MSMFQKLVNSNGFDLRLFGISLIENDWSVYYTMRSEVNGQVLMTFAYDSIEMNVPLDDSMFEKPE